MDNSIWGMLNETEKALLRATERDALTELDEDGLSDLHALVRRARNKYSKLYRRRAGAQVAEDGRRSSAHAQHARTLVKAEAFEEALGRVSTALAKAARASAAELKAERLAAARSQPVPARTAASPKRSNPKGVAARGGAPAARRNPATEKARASTKAKGARRQAKRDSR